MEWQADKEKGLGGEEAFVFRHKIKHQKPNNFIIPVTASYL
jgi:hypothetical protein